VMTTLALEKDPDSVTGIFNVRLPILYARLSPEPVRPLAVPDSLKVTGPESTQLTTTDETSLAGITPAPAVTVHV